MNYTCPNCGTTGLSASMFLFHEGCPPEPARPEAPTTDAGKEGDMGLENTPALPDALRDVRHWFIQKPTAHNCPYHTNGAVFQEFAPTVAEQGGEWIKVWSSEDLSKLLGMGVSRWVEVAQENARLRAEVERYERALKEIGNGAHDSFRCGEIARKVLESKGNGG